MPQLRLDQPVLGYCWKIMVKIEPSVKWETDHYQTSSSPGDCSGPWLPAYDVGLGCLLLVPMSFFSSVEKIFNLTPSSLTYLRELMTWRGWHNLGRKLPAGKEEPSWLRWNFLSLSFCVLGCLELFIIVFLCFGMFGFFFHCPFLFWDVGVFTFQLM